MSKFILLLFAITAFVCYSQKNSQSDRFEYKSFSFSPLGFYSDFEVGGLVFSGDVSFLYNKEHIFTVSGTAGSEVCVLSCGDSFEQVNVLYGRELALNKTVFIDAHLGLGYFSFKAGGHHSKRTIKMGLPLVCKLRFKAGKQFSIGLQFQTNINSINNIYAIGLLLQWNKI